MPDLPPIEYRNTCAVCGKEFATTKKTRRWCSAECCTVYKQKWRESHICRDAHPLGERRTQEPKYRKTCIQCGKLFDTASSRALLCSKDCRKARQKAYQKQYDAARREKHK